MGRDRGPQRCDLHGPQTPLPKRLRATGGDATLAIREGFHKRARILGQPTLEWGEPA
jgi:hypothetical protein